MWTWVHVLMAEWVLQVVLALSSWSRDRCGSKRTANSPALPCWLEHWHGICNVLLFPCVITGTKQQSQESGGKKDLRENLKAEEIWRKWIGRQEMNSVGLRGKKPWSSSHFFLKAIQRAESFRAAAGGALGDSAQAHYIVGRTGGFLPWGAERRQR